MTPSTSQKAIGRRLKKLRLARGLTQRDLSEPAYTAAYVSTIEAGKRMPSPTAIAHFAERLGVDPAEIVTGRPKDFVADLQLKLNDAAQRTAAGRLRDAAALYEEVEQGAAKFELRTYEARALVGRGMIAEREGKVDAAVRHFTAADELLADEPAPQRVEAVAGLARCHQMKGDLRYATHLLETYLIVLRDTRQPDPLALMRTYSSLVWPYSELGLYDQANEAATTALSFESRVDDPAQVANMHVNVARELLRLGKIDDALYSLKRAHELFESLNWRSEMARADLARGIVLANRKKHKPALAALEKALETFAETDNRVNQARTLNEIARVRRITNDVPAAVGAAEDAIDLLDGLEVAELALSHRELGLCLAEDHPRKAEKHLRTAVEIYRKAGEREQVAVTFRELGDLLSRRGALDSGREAYREGLLVFNG
ncbi:MAG: helix-turn-helix domain-containing protein [Actinomycetota bacterium]|nr:helix-turn-helix domain-containing protein [Actinomycetota bacterium]